MLTVKRLGIGRRQWRREEAVAWGRVAGQEVWEEEPAGGRENGILGTSFEPLK